MGSTLTKPRNGEPDGPAGVYPPSRACSTADLVIALYNPASRSRTEQIALAKVVLLEVRSATTIVIVGRDVGRAGELLTVTTLGELDPATIDMSCLVIVCASGTVVTEQGQVWTPRFVAGPTP